MPFKKEFALYKGDTFIMIGTADEIAKSRNIAIKTVYYLSTPAHHKRAKKTNNYLLAEKLD